MEDLLSASGAADDRVVLGLNHEQQHQELLLTDIKHAFWSNPLHPAYASGPLPAERIARTPEPSTWVDFPGGLQEIGYANSGFSYDNELPRHRIFLEPYRLASRLVTCGEYLQFIEDGGYTRSELWLSEGWLASRNEQWQAPLYWRRDPDSPSWQVFTLRGLIPLDDLLATPVCHISYFEADAYARWAGAGLPTEAEWETAAAPFSVAGNLLETQFSAPASARGCISVAAAFRRRLGVDRQLVSALSRFSTPPWRPRRVQRQVHVQSDGAARRFGRYPGLSPPRQLPQLFLARDPLAVFRRSSGQSLRLTHA